MLCYLAKTHSKSHSMLCGNTKLFSRFLKILKELIFLKQFLALVPASKIAVWNILGINKYLLFVSQETLPSSENNAPFFWGNNFFSLNSFHTITCDPKESSCIFTHGYFSCHVWLRDDHRAWSKPIKTPFLLSGKESVCQCRRHRRPWFDPWVGKIPWRRKWQPTQVFLPGKSHGQRSLVHYSPWFTKSQTWLSTHVYCMYAGGL